MYSGPHGKLWTQEQYDAMVNSCKDMKQEGIIPSSDQILNCQEWVLTYEGTAWITKYVLQKNGFLN